MNWNRRIASAIVTIAVSIGGGVSAQAVDTCDIEISTASLKVAFNFNFSCAITNENPFPIVVALIEVLDSNGNVRASASNVTIDPEDTRQVFGTGLNDRYHCHVTGIESAARGLGFQTKTDPSETIAENTRVIFDVQSGGNTIGESEGRIVRRQPDI